jgi:hypothetical protein
MTGPPPRTRRNGTPVRTETFDALVEELRRQYGSDVPFLLPRLEDRVRRRLGLAPLSAAGSALAGVLGVGLRLAAALLATALVGRWAEIPWGRWVAVLVFYGVLDATQPLRMPPLDVTPGPRVRRTMEDYLALLPTLVRASDLQDLADFTRRWLRLPLITAVGVAVTAAVLLASWWSAPTALTELPPGSIVLLGFLLYDFGAVTVGAGLVEWAFRVREARYDHHLFWPSPADSPEVQASVRTVSALGFATGMWITTYLALSLVLVGWGSPLLLPIGVGFVMIGYLATIGQVFGIRASIARIVRRARDQRLQGLRHRIEAFEARYTALSAQEYEHLGHLLDLHDRIRNAPTAPTTTHTAMHTAVGLIIPTLMFVVTVFGEVSAERILDTILP